MTNPKWPKEIERGLIPTDNAMGIMTTELSPAAEAFISHARQAQRPLLEVGAAYGNATLPALGTGATVIANDLSLTELAVLAESAPAGSHRHLVLAPARFPQELKLGEGSLSGVLYCISSRARRWSFPSRVFTDGSNQAASSSCS
ncbi:MAG TPA: hypothetical protein PLX89_00335 [Verrucomicrobiota bacterium]|nr:hypothetical protein [Verrucomicrobiales bacterium]HRI11425.1 hypothetical protein [Verrucomicrobiota bacterium]